MNNKITNNNQLIKIMKYIKKEELIEFEKAMKTFIPEYVEYIQQRIGSPYKLGTIYKTNPNGLINGGMAFYQYNQHRFKPSTKEAYDAQFVVKKPEFVLPKKWYLKITAKNKDIINHWRKNIIQYDNSDCKYQTISQNGSGLSISFINEYDSHQEITFEQFQKYVLKEETVEEKVIKPLPQFKVIESNENITKVENNEGNQFFIGDVVKSELGNTQKITRFKYNVNKTDILAVCNNGIQISINKIEHYIEPKVEVKEETLLEKAKRLYPVGTKFKSAITKTLFTVKDHTRIQNTINNICFNTNELNRDRGYYGCILSVEGKWAEIIE